MTILTLLIVAPVVIITGFFAVELFAGLVPLGSRKCVADAARAVIVIPAHDEQGVIARTVAELRLHSGRNIAVLVVADNCTDETATAASSAGADVLVRNDPTRRGKGYALAAARAHLAADAPDVVVVLDADCGMDGASLRTLVGSAAASGRACQAVNLLAPDLSAPVLVQISTFAFMIKNLVRQRALHRLARRAHLNGTGMALPWAIFADADLGGANIVEDLALGLELSARAAPPLLVEGARVWSPAASTGGTLVQRRRWEGGYLSTALRVAPRAIVRSIARADVRGICAALDLAIPPLALLFIMNLVASVSAVAGLVAGEGVWPLVVELAVGLLASLALALAWAREGRRFASTATLLRLPLYIAWKMPMYLGLARSGAPKEWLRTGR